METNMIRKLILLIPAILVIVSTGLATAQDELAENLKLFKPYIGKTWKGEFANSTPEKPIFDVSRWERALNGQAIRILHSVNNGEYGGESIIFWDKQKAGLVFYYFTTAGFFTTGSIKFENGKMISHEYVTGNQNGVTEVKAIGEIMVDGKLRSTSQYLQKDKWVQGHEVTYVEAPEAQVIFK